MRRTLRALTTRRLDGRSAVAVAVRRWKDDVRRDLGGDLTRTQETILEAAAQAWVILSSLDDWIARQPSLVTRKRTLLPVVRDRMQVADSLARHLERLGLDRKRQPVADLSTYLAERPPRRAAADETDAAGVSNRTTESALVDTPSARKPTGPLVPSRTGETS